MLAHILIVDDDILQCELWNMVLRLAGYNTHAVHTGQDGLDYVEQQSIDLVILDFTLPDLDGLEVLRRLRATVRGINLSVILLTGNHQALSQVGEQDWNPVAVIAKPTLPWALTERIQIMLSTLVP
jgi:DNA-binding response OmpR family regulator